MEKFLEAVFEFCASLKLAVILILMLAAQLAAATFYEARFGGAAVQERVYGSNFFLLSMALLAINVMAAALIRYPWKRKQTGFVITHIGIEVLLLGCLISFRASVDGRVALRPGDTVNDISLRSEQIGVVLGNGKQYVLPVSLWSEAGYPNLAMFVAKRGDIQIGWPVGKVLEKELADGVQLQILDWLPAAKLERTYVDDPSGAPAVEIHLAGNTPMGQPVDEKVWVHDDHKNPATQMLFGGVIEVALGKARNDAEIADFLAPAHPEQFATSDGLLRGRLHLLQSPSGRLYARMFGKSGLKAATEVKVGQALPPWVGIGVSITKHVPAARLQENYVPAHVAPSKMDEAMRAIRVALILDGQREEMWLARGAGAKAISTPRGTAQVSYGYDGYQLPFSFTLLDAQKTDDPGTMNAAAYMSKVAVADRAGHRTQETITMNQPMTMDGLTFYQAGFDDRLGPTPVSYLSVRRDPGWVIKYCGCGLIVGGIFTMFYMKAYFQKPVATKETAKRRAVAGVA
jgi:hypothetical protein